MHSLVYEIFPVHHSLQNWTQIGACVHGWWRPPPRLASWHQHETCRLLTTAQWRLVDNFFVVDHTTVTDPTSRHQVLAYLVMHCRCQMIIIYHFISFSCIFDLYSCCHITGYRRMLLTAANCRRRQLVCFDCLFLYYILSINVEGFMQDLNCNIFMTVHSVSENLRFVMNSAKNCWNFWYGNSKHFHFHTVLRMLFSLSQDLPNCAEMRSCWWIIRHATRPVVTLKVHFRLFGY